MSTDHIHIMNKDEEISFNCTGEGGDVDLIIKDLELFADTLCVGLKAKSSDGNQIEIYLEVDDGTTAASDYKTTSETDWQDWVDDDKFEVDTSELTKGNVTVTLLAADGVGIIKDAYIYQE